MTLRTQAIKHVLLNPAVFSAKVLGMPLRDYQAEVIQAVVTDILEQRGSILTVYMSRQSGKNEASAHLEAYLLNLFQRRYASGVKTSPTFKPQTITSMRRLENRLCNPWNAGRWRKRYGYIFRLGNAEIIFLSGDKTANVVSHTANLLMEVDEAQDFDEETFNRKFRPMTSTTNATTIMYGTAWTDDNLMAKQIAINKDLEKKDGRKRHFEFPWQTLAQQLPAYQRFIMSEIQRLGSEHHPVFQTQYALKTIAALGRLFAPADITAMHRAPDWTGGTVIAGLDPAGEAEDPADAPDHDLAVLSIARTLPGQQPPGAHIYEQHTWQGEKHTKTMPEILTILQQRNVALVVVDATGMGEVYASYLSKALGEDRVLAVKYTTTKKSELAFQMLAAAKSRHLTIAPDMPPDFWREIREARRHALPGRLLNFDAPGHDDRLNTMALIVHGATNIKHHPPAAEHIEPEQEEDTY